MAININTEYPGRVTAPTTAYPYGSSKNETSPGAGDGTPYELARANDIFGFQQALLKSRGIVPSGNSDEVRASQYLQAVVEYASGAATLYTDSGVADAYVADPVNADSQGPTQYFDGMVVYLPVANTNTGASTINVDSVGAVAIEDKAGAALTGGELVAGQTVAFRYSTANASFTFLGAVGLDTVSSSVTHNFASDADYTLTAAQNLFGQLVATDSGVLLTAARNVIVANIPRLIVFTNSTAQVLTVKTLAGTGAAVPPGAKQILACDGINVAAATGSVLLGSAVATPPVFMDSAGSEIGTLCRAWVNFNGTGVVAIRASFNVSSVTDNGVGDYTINATIALPDANCAILGNCSNINNNPAVYTETVQQPNTYTRTSSAWQIATATVTSASSGISDKDHVWVGVFR